MNNEELSGRQLASLTGLFIIGSSSAIGSSGIAKNDTWIALILAVVAAIPLVLIYARISTLFKRRNLFDIIYEVFGKWLGSAVALMMTVYCLHLGTLVLRDFPEFAQATSLYKTPKIVLAALIGFVCAYLARLGAASFGKAGILFSVLVGVVVLFTFLFLIPNMNLKNLQPVLATPPDVIALNAAKLFCTPLGESVLLLCLFCDMKPGQSKSKAFVTGLLFGGFYLLVSVLRNIMSLGAGNFTSLYFPSYNAVSTINIGDFFQRAEVMVASYLLMCDIIKIAVAIYAACLGTAKLLHIADYRKTVFPVTLLMIVLSVALFQNTMDFFQWSSAYFAYALPFQAVIPVTLWIWGEANRGKL